MRLAWSTDIHLDAHGKGLADRFVNRVRRSRADVLLIGGDISNCNMLYEHLCFLASKITIPIYFVLGNHDAYGGSIYDSKKIANKVSSMHDNLFFLEETGVVQLTDETWLAGVGGWADARTGDFLNAPGLLNDYVYINELVFLPDRIARDVLHRMGDEAADRMSEILADVPAECRSLFVLTHTPPWREACWHEGRISDDTWAPHYTCIALGKVLEEFAKQRSDVDVVVLCGHTHGLGISHICENLVVHTGAAEYGDPNIAQIFSIR